jgi:antitoxin (DNA-binding transcriptional repressor) of toxin-antitoxin stability system
MTERRIKSDEARRTWRDVLDYVRSGGSVVIEHYNRPVAQISPVGEPSRPKTLGRADQRAVGAMLDALRSHTDDPTLADAEDGDATVEAIGRLLTIVNSDIPEHQRVAARRAADLIMLALSEYAGLSVDDWLGTDYAEFHSRVLSELENRVADANRRSVPS